MWWRLLDCVLQTERQPWCQAAPCQQIHTAVTLLTSTGCSTVVRTRRVFNCKQRNKVDFGGFILFCCSEARKGLNHHVRGRHDINDLPRFLVTSGLHTHMHAHTTPSASSKWEQWRTHSRTSGRRAGFNHPHPSLRLLQSTAGITQTQCCH